MTNIKTGLCVLLLTAMCFSYFTMQATARYTENLSTYDLIPTIQQQPTMSAFSLIIKNDIPSVLISQKTWISLPLILGYYGFKVGLNHSSTIIPDTTPKLATVSNSIEPLQIPVLMYHILLPNRNDTISVDPRRFKQQMLALKAAGYTSITENQFLSYPKDNTPLPQKPILITFDDGYLNNFTEAYPILKRLNMHASMYVIASRISETDGFTEGEYEKISWQQAREMKGTMSIQSHTWDSHSKQLTIEDQSRGLITNRLHLNTGLETQQEFENRTYNDLLVAKKAIEKNVGTEVVAISYPYGEYTADTIRLAEKVGYQMAFTIHNGPNTQSSPLFELNRFTVDGNYSGEQLVQVIESN